LKKNSKFFLIVLALGLLGFWLLQRDDPQQTSLVFVAPVREDIVASITISGRVDAKEKARLRFVSGGKVVYLGAKEGDSVKKGQSIATIDRRALQKQLDQNLNNYMKERNNFENTKDDIKDRTLDTVETRAVASEQYNLDNQVLNVEMQNIAIANTTITSPFDGILTVSPTNVTGVQLLASDYFEIVNPKSLIFRANIDEIDIDRIEKSQTGQISLDAYNDEKIDTYVSYISYTSSESSNGTVFLLEFPINEQNIDKYRIGMNGDVSIKIAEKQNVLTVPLDAISERDGKTFVKVKADNKEQQMEREIKVGLESDEKIEILEGLSENDQVVLPQ
jgi:HlyD family secretion protein